MTPTGDEEAARAGPPAEGEAPTPGEGAGPGRETHIEFDGWTDGKTNLLICLDCSLIVSSSADFNDGAFHVVIIVLAHAQKPPEGHN